MSSQYHVCAITVARDEAELLEHNIRYHAKIGFDCFAIMDHFSRDDTQSVLQKLSKEFPIVWIRKNVREFDHESYANEILELAQRQFNPVWVFPLDADEFLWSSWGLEGLLQRVSKGSVKYASLKWLNSLPSAHTASITGALKVRTFYEPWPERHWQHEGHLRKSFCGTHRGIRVVVGGHYFDNRTNASFFGDCDGPQLLDVSDACLLHFESRGSVDQLYLKWKHLSEDLIEPNYSLDAPWNEKRRIMAEYCREYELNRETFVRFWNSAPRTIWGTPIEKRRLFSKDAVADWIEGMTA